MVSLEDMDALQRYITANDATQYAHLHPDTLLLDLSHSNLKQKHIEIRFDKHSTIATVRAKIHQTTGTPPHFQRLQILSSISSTTPLFDIPPEADDDKMLGYYSLQCGMAIHCIDVDPHSGSRGGGYEDVSLVEKYKMSDEEYAKRKGTLRDWAKEQKKKDNTFTLAKHAREHREMMEAQRQAKLGLELPKGFEYDHNGTVIRTEEDKDVNGGSKEEKLKADGEFGTDSVQGIDVGMRCEVRPGTRRGKVAFVGEVSELGSGGYWVGVIFDEPVGKTDGTAKGGKRYFEAPGPAYGGFVRGKNIEVGDFPERDIMDELDSDSEEEL